MAPRSRTIPSISEAFPVDVILDDLTGSEEFGSSKGWFVSVTLGNGAKDVCDVGIETAELVKVDAELELVATSKGIDFGTVEVGDSIDDGRSLREVTIEVVVGGSEDVVVLDDTTCGADVVSITRVWSFIDVEVECSVVDSEVEVMGVVCGRLDVSVGVVVTETLVLVQELVELN